MPEKGEQELRGQIEELVAATHAERDALRRSSITMVILSSTMLVIVAIFALVNYNQFKTEWTEEKLVAGFQKEMESLTPGATEEMQQLGQHLLPIYAIVSRKQFVDMTPEIVDRLRKEVEGLGENLKADAETRLAVASARISHHAEDVTFATYPGLQDDAEKERLTKALRATSETAITDATREFSELFATDIRAIEKRIRSFNVTRTDETETDLEKRFIHLWLQLLDAEIMGK